MIKYATILSVVVVMATTIILIDSQSSGPADASNPEHAAPSPTNRIYASGIVEGRSEEIQVRPEQIGRVHEVFIAPGRLVKKGDQLLRLDDARQQQEVALGEAMLESAQAELEKLHNGARAEERDEARALHRAAEARLQQAIRTRARTEQLRSQNAISQQEADDQQAIVDALRAELDAADSRVRLIEAPPRTDELRSAAASVAAAQAQLDLARIGLQKTQLVAPCDGQVLDVNVEPGELTGPDAIEPLVVLTDTSKIRVRAFVEELDAPRVEVGMPARITADGLPGKTFSGRVASTNPSMEPKSLFAGKSNELYDVKVREVMVDLETSEGLIVGLRVDVTFDLNDQN